MKHRRAWIITGVSLAAVWGLVAVMIAVARASEPSVADVTSLLASRDVASMSAEERLKFVDDVAERVNRLGFDQRRDLGLQRDVRELFDAMTEAERARYIEKTLPGGMEQLFESINAMDRDERRAFVDETLAEMRRDMDRVSRAEMEQRVDDPSFQRVLDEGMRAYLRDASAEAKLDLEPLILEMQRRLRELR